MVEHGHELLLQHIVIIVLLYYCLSLLWLIYKEPEVRMCRKKTVCTGFSYIRGFRSPRGVSEGIPRGQAGVMDLNTPLLISSHHSFRHPTYRLFLFLELSLFLS